jgi:hypothetical protein
MSQTYDLTLPTHWEQVYNESKAAEAVLPGKFSPLKRIDIPILLHEAVIAIGCSSTTSPAHWRYAGELIQRHTISGVSSGLVDGQTTRCLLNNIKVVLMPLLTPDYRLSFDVPPWIQSIDLSVWRYTGPVADSTIDLLETLKVDIARIEYGLNFR